MADDEIAHIRTERPPAPVELRLSSGSPQLRPHLKG